MLGLIGSADVTVPPESHDGSAMLNWRRFRALRPGHCVSRNDWFVAELARGSRVARPAKRLSGAASREQRTSRRLPARLVLLLGLVFGLRLALHLALSFVLHLARLDVQLGRLVRARVEAGAHFVALLELFQLSHLGAVARDRHARGDLHVLLDAG